MMECQDKADSELPQSKIKYFRQLILKEKPCCTPKTAPSGVLFLSLLCKIGPEYKQFAQFYDGLRKKH